jgi:hypothetical protein
MKNLKLTLLLIILFANLMSTAQERVVDIRVEFTDPQERTVVYSPGILVVTTKIVNQGPDSLFPKDTFIYSIYHTFHQEVPRNSMPLNRILAPNDSFYFNDTLPLDISAEAKNLYVGHSGGVTAFKSAANDNRPLAPEYWETSRDNYPSLRLYHERKNVGIQAIDRSTIKLVPNPTVDNTFKIVSENSTFQFIEIYSLSGQVILKRTLASDTIQLPENTPANMYYVKLFNEHEVVIKRLVTQ